MPVSAASVSAVIVMWSTSVMTDVTDNRVKRKSIRSPKQRRQNSETTTTSQRQRINDTWTSILLDPLRSSQSSSGFSDSSFSDSSSPFVLHDLVGFFCVPSFPSPYSSLCLFIPLSPPLMPGFTSLFSCSFSLPLDPRASSSSSCSSSSSLFLFFSFSCSEDYFYTEL